MKKKWINIRIETKSREFQSKSLLAYHLINKGYGLIVKHEYGRQVQRFPRGIYLLNNIFKTNYLKLKDIVEYGNKIYLLDEEGLVYRSETEYLKRIPRENMEFVTKFLCYGFEQFEIVSNKFPSKSENIEITGNPRINLLNKKFDILDGKAVEEIKRQYCPFILIVSNFSTVNLFGSNKNIEDRYKVLLDKYIRLKLIANKDEEKDFINQFDYYNKIFESFLELVRVISRKFPQMNIIIRPHPSEDQGIWRELESMHTNISVIYKGTLTEWIKGANLVIENNCTSAIESLFLNRACISYRPYKDKRYDQPLPNKLSVNMSSQEEILNIIRKLILISEDANIFEKEYHNYKKLVKQNIANDEEDKSIIKIVELIEREEIDYYYFNPFIYKIRILHPAILIPRLKRGLKMNIIFFTHKIFKILNINNSKLFNYLDNKTKRYKYSEEYRKNKLEDLNEIDFQEIFSKYNKIYNKNLKIKIDKIDKDTFIIKGVN